MNNGEFEHNFEIPSQEQSTKQPVLTLDNLPEELKYCEEVLPFQPDNISLLETNPEFRELKFNAKSQADARALLQQLIVRQYMESDTEQNPATILQRSMSGLATVEPLEANSALRFMMGNLECYYAENPTENGIEFKVGNHGDTRGKHTNEEFSKRVELVMQDINK